MTKIESLDHLDAFLDSTSGKASFLFKHSTACGVSTQALREYHSFLGEIGADGHAVVDLLAHHHVSNAVAERTGVPHASPQVLLFRDGGVVWHASHWDITGEALREALMEFGGARPENPSALC